MSDRSSCEHSERANEVRSEVQGNNKVSMKSLLLLLVSAIFNLFHNCELRIASSRSIWYTSSKLPMSLDLVP
jgi:hypothetical protein